MGGNTKKRPKRPSRQRRLAWWREQQKAEHKEVVNPSSASPEASEDTSSSLNGQSTSRSSVNATEVLDSSASSRNSTSSFDATGDDSSSASSRNSTSSFDATGDDFSSVFMEDTPPQGKGLFDITTTMGSVLYGQIDDRSTEKQSPPITFNVSLVKGDPQTGITLGKVLLGAAVFIGLTVFVVGTAGAAGAALPFVIEATQSLLALVKLALAPKLALGIAAGVGLLIAGAADYKLNLSHKLGHTVSSLFGGKQGRDAGNGDGTPPPTQRENKFFTQDDVDQGQETRPHDVDQDQDPRPSLCRT